MMNILKETDIKPGMKIQAMFKKTSDSVFGNIYLPLVVLHEYKRYFVCTVLPHRNPYSSFGLSSPYPMTISKIDLELGEIIAKK